jgi:hypothetical protein
VPARRPVDVLVDPVGETVFKVRTIELDVVEGRRVTVFIGVYHHHGIVDTETVKGKRPETV